ncbi:MAG: hypothetical protein GF417_13770 [Candidatus Latescibacteria bacterium]|nr:hypothetical protein [bacterium]MBD3425498.1 hypothetical protein [Candidatus Latescibacterota bacterium]
MKTRLAIIMLLVLISTAAAESAEIGIIIDHPSISPDSDGSKDFSRVEVTLQNNFDSLAVTLEDSGETQVYDSLLNLISPDPAVYSFFWTGRDSLDSLLPDDQYLLYLRAVRADTVTEIRRTVIIDTDAPVINITRIEPGIFSPALPGGPVLIYYSVSGFSPGCTAGGTITDPDGDTTELDLQEVNGDSSYTYEWDPTSPEDGIYTVTFNIEDLAGNRGTDEGHINVDAEGPAITIDEISSPTNQPPDLISGSCYDRSRVDSLRFTWREGGADANQIFPDTVYSENDTTYWNVNIRDSIYSEPQQSYLEGTYTFSLTARDSLNQSENEELTFTIDTTAPPAPVLVQPTSFLLKPEIAITYAEELGGIASDVRFYTYHEGLTDSLTKSGFIPNPVIELNEGVTEIWARSIDQAGNISGSSNRITVEYRKAFTNSFPEAFRGTDLFRVTTAMEAFRVEVRIFTLTGEEVRSITATGPDDYFELEWDLTTNDGEEVRNGAYLVVISTSFYGGSKRTDKEFISVVR